MKAMLNKEFIHSSHGHAGIQPSPGKQGSITGNGYLGRQMPSGRTSPPSSFFPQLYTLSKVSYGLEYPFGQLGSAVLAVPPPSFLCPPRHSLVGWGEKQKRALTLCKHRSAVTKTSLCYQHCFQNKSKTQCIPATVKKINSTPAKISTW